ncbi:MAG: hypothetical protein MJK18_00265 [Bdellovibrionales bacterium]|nr:hypothetical protein [Bdellovibrionales bacterium]
MTWRGVHKLSTHLIIVFADDQSNVDTPVIIEEPTPSVLDVSYPFMNCQAPDSESDFKSVTLMVNASQPETGMVVMMRNPKFDDLLKDDLSYETDQDLSDFDFSPVAVTSNDLKIKKLADDGTIEIQGGFVGFTTVAQQTIDTKNVKGTLKLKSVLGPEVIEIQCSVYPAILARAFDQ